MENNGICWNYWKSPNTEATTSKKAKVTYFRPTVLHDHAASRLVKNARLNNRYYYWFCTWKQNYLTYHYSSQANTVFSGALNVATFRVALCRNCSAKKNQQCPYTSWKVVLEQGSDMKSSILPLISTTSCMALTFKPVCP